MGPELESLSGHHGLTRGHVPSGRCKLTQGLENGKKKQFLNIRKLMGNEKIWKVKGFSRAKRKRQLPESGVLGVQTPPVMLMKEHWDVFKNRGSLSLRV